MRPIRFQVEGLLLRGYFNARLHGFCKELYEHRERLWVFVDVEGVEPTNNAAEQALRHAVIWRKLSFGTQSASGSRFVERMLTVIETCRRQNRNVYAWLTQAVEAHHAGQPSSVPPAWGVNDYVRWHANRGVVTGVFDRHDFSFKWSYAEMAPTITGLGYNWTLEQTGKALKELIELAGGEDSEPRLFKSTGANSGIRILHGSGDALDINDGTVDCITMDPPYESNVMYAELADFFYVWLKRTVGLFYPNAFAAYLTDKDQEAVANVAKFKGKQGGAKNFAVRDYQERMAAIFRECRRVVKPHGVMTVMFTHKASGAWDALANGLIQAGFVITASWPINTEAEGSLHIKEKSAAKSTIFLVCRPRMEGAEDADTVYWEESRAEGQ